MSQFSNQLQASMEDAGFNQIDICEKTKISQGQMSRYLSADNRPGPDSLELLLKLFNEKNRTALLLAYLNDDIPEEYRHLINISGEKAAARVSEEAPQYRTQMPRRLRAALDFLGERSIEDQRAATVLINTAELLKSSAPP